MPRAGWRAAFRRTRERPARRRGAIAGGVESPAMLVRARRRGIVNRTGSASSPFTPGFNQSTIPPVRKATDGTPTAPASTPTIPNGSGHRLGTIRTSAFRRSSKRRSPPTQPGNSLGTPNLFASRCQRPRSGPSPAMVKNSCRSPRLRWQRATARTARSPPLPVVNRPRNSTCRGDSRAGGGIASGSRLMG